MTHTPTSAATPREPRAPRHETFEERPVPRASWFGVFGGALLALAVSIALGLLGLAIGVTTIAPMAEGGPSLQTFSTAAGIWWLVTGLLALLAGGWATARLATLPQKSQSLTHGLVTWSLFIVGTVVLMTFTATAVLTGAFRLVGSTAGLLAQGAETLVQAAPGQLPSVDLPLGGGERGGAQGSDPVNVSWDQVLSEARQILRQAETAQLRPENLEEDVQDVTEEVSQASREDTLGAAMNELEAALADLRSAARGTVTAADKEAVVNVLVARTDMSRQEAQQSVDRWSSQLSSAWQDVRRTLAQIPEQARQRAAQVAEQASNAMATAGWWSFFYLVLTALAAAGGAVLGTPSRRHTARATA